MLGRPAHGAHLAELVIVEPLRVARGDAHGVQLVGHGLLREGDAKGIAVVAQGGGGRQVHGAEPTVRRASQRAELHLLEKERGLVERITQIEPQLVSRHACANQGGEPVLQ